MKSLAFAPEKTLFSTENTLCFHCHEPLGGEKPVVFEDKNFCCEGCRTVFEILDSNGLCRFYDLDEAAGVSQKNQKDARAWAFLDDPEALEKLLLYKDEKSARAELSLPAMHCASCVWLLENLWKLDSGVLASRVDFVKKTISLHFLVEKTSLRRLAALLTSIGYAPDIRLDAGQKRAEADPKIVWRLGVAGFAAGNIMLLAFPEYLGLEAEKEGLFFRVFGFLSLVLALPVLLFSARPFFESAWNGLKKGHLNLDLPIAAAAAMLFFRSAFEIVFGLGAGYMDSFAALVFLLLIGRWFQQKAFHRLAFDRDFRSYFPVSALRKRPDGSGEDWVLASKLELGDVILVKNGEILPADGVLLRGRGQIDYAFVTGESEPQARTSGDRLFAGGRQVGELIEVALTRTPSTSYLTQLWNDEAFQNPSKTRVSAIADAAGKWFTWAILAVSAGAFFWHFQTSLGAGIEASTAVLMVACPCAAAIALPFVMGNALRILGRNGLFLRSAAAIEAFSEVKNVVFDKTGTLTTASGGSLEWRGAAFSTIEKRLLKSAARQSNHPVSRRIFAFFEKEIPTAEPDFFEERAGEGLAARFGDRQIEFKKSPDGGTSVVIDGTERGQFLAKTELRKGFFEVVDWAKKLGPLALLSGDGERERGIFEPFFAQKKSSNGGLFFNQTPQQKLDFIKKQEQNGQKTLFLGDGLNDAGALRAASLGISVSENSGQFAPACDGILAAEKFEKLPAFAAFARSASRVAIACFVIGSVYNLIGLSWAVTGQLSPIVAAVLMPLSSVTVAVFGLAATSFWAKRLGL